MACGIEQKPDQARHGVTLVVEVHEAAAVVARGEAGAIFAADEHRDSCGAGQRKSGIVIRLHGIASCCSRSLSALAARLEVELGRKLGSRAETRQRKTIRIAAHDVHLRLIPGTDLHLALVHQQLVIGSIHVLDAEHAVTRAQRHT